VVNLLLHGILVTIYNRKDINKLRPLVQYRRKGYGNIGRPNMRRGGGEGEGERRGGKLKHSTHTVPINLT
jgi:hypothetical protein